MVKGASFLSCCWEMNDSRRKPLTAGSVVGFFFFFLSFFLAVPQPAQASSSNVWPSAGSSSTMGSSEGMMV